ncbi:MAG TPA: hypothetical protein VLG71_02155, partial [Candidatus Limnocylindria bacterium]|nr:hypothetical protein [Candidatus Limnocylindria bacterium]
DEQKKMQAEIEQQRRTQASATSAVQLDGDDEDDLVLEGIVLQDPAVENGQLVNGRQSSLRQR